MKKKTSTLLLVIIACLLLFGLLKSGNSDELIPFVLVVGGAGLIIYGVKNRRRSNSPSALPIMTKEKEAHYLESGMTEKEIEFFRETMNQTKKQVLQLQTNINKNAKLKAIDLRHDTLRASKALFKELVKDPQKLHFANHFLYTHLPNMVDLTAKFIEINGHEIKTKETYEKIEESSQIIDQMAALIAKDYQQFVADDLEDLDVELSIAKQSLKRDNSL